MGGPALGALARLYERARFDDVVAWGELLDVSVPRLASWLSGVRGKGLAPWEAEEIAGDAMVRMGLRMQALPTWLHAWHFARKVAYRSCRRWKGLPTGIFVISLNGEAPVEPIDPRSLAFIAETDLEDALQGFVEQLPQEKAEILPLMVDTYLAGKLTLRRLARRLGISPKTLAQRIAGLKSIWRQRFRSPST